MKWVSSQIGWDKMTKHTVQRSACFFMLVAILAGCSLITMEEVPSTDLIKKWMGSFLIDADQIKGIYRNLDVDSVVFTYRTSLTTEEAFLVSLTNSLAGTTWQHETNATEFIEFRRGFAKGETAPDRPDMAMFASLEVARLSFNPTTRGVVVAYVQADSMKNVARFEDTGEGKWAEKAIWLKFNELRKK